MAAKSLSQTTQEQAEAARRGRITAGIDATVHKLSSMQRTAVIEYLCGKSQVESCDIAGYAHPRSQASRVFKNKKVQAVIDEYFHSQEMTAAAWVQRMSEQATAIYANYFYWDAERGELAIDVEGLLADGYGYLVKDVAYRGSGADRQVIEFQPAFDAQMAIARYLGLFTDKQEISGPEGEPIRFIEVLSPPEDGD